MICSHSPCMPTRYVQRQLYFRFYPLGNLHKQISLFHVCSARFHVEHLPPWKYTEQSLHPQDGNTTMVQMHTETGPKLPIQSLKHPSCG